MIHGEKTNRQCKEISHFRVLALPLPKGASDAIYFLLNDDNTVSQYVTDKYGNYKLVVGNSLQTNTPIYNYEPLEQPDGVVKIFTVGNNYLLNSLVVRVNGLTAAIIIDYTIQAGNKIKLSYAPVSTEHIHMDYIKTN